MAEVKSILIVGVGGQGTLLTSMVLGDLFVEKGLDVKMSEVHGMAQRGGSVVTQVRYGEKVNSPLVAPNSADVIMAFEKLEAMRWLKYLKPNGKLIINNQKIPPMPVIIGDEKYPEDIIKKAKNMGIEIYDLNASEIANACGNAKAANVVLLGVLSKLLDFPKEDWVSSIKKIVPEKVLDINLKAFEKGRED